MRNAFLGTQITNLEKWQLAGIEYKPFLYVDMNKLSMYRHLITIDYAVQWCIKAIIIIIIFVSFN